MSQVGLNMSTIKYNVRESDSAAECPNNVVYTWSSDDSMSVV